jgi:putative nucleotidyltransferase with HDIG domain
MGIPYRASQFALALAGRLSEEDLRLALDHLTPPLQQLFLQMNTSDQLHAVRVLQTLLRVGEDHPDLLSAALLHDIGKARASLRLYDRVIIVLAAWVFPDALRRWGTGDARGWRRPFVIAAQHPDWGAEMAHKAGGSRTLIDLIRRHQETSPQGSGTEVDRLLDKLKWADGLN